MHHNANSKLKYLACDTSGGKAYAIAGKNVSANRRADGVTDAGFSASEQLLIGIFSGIKCQGFCWLWKTGVSAGESPGVYVGRNESFCLGRYILKYLLAKLLVFC